MARILTNMNEIVKNIFFKSGVCHYCKCVFLPIKRCNSCKILAYCSKEHQAKDWKNHKDICKVIASEKAALTYNVKNYRDFIQYKKQRGLYWRCTLGRALQTFETQMWLFSMACAVCFRREGLFPCVECLSEYYCSTEHQNKHKEVHSKFCKQFRLSLDMDCYFFHHDPVFSLQPIQVPEELNSIPEDANFIYSIIESLEAKEDICFMANCDEILSGLILLFGLQQAEVISHRKLLKKTLNIHIVGSSDFEVNLNWKYIVDIMFQWIRNIEIIRFDFIGPGCIEDVNLVKHFEKVKNFTASAHFYNSFYHNEISKLQKPDLVVAFNSGLNEFSNSDNDYWKESLKSLVYYDKVPLILTAYTETEIICDINQIMEVSNSDVETVYGPKKNIFANLKPLQDWENETDPLYYINNFIVVIRKKVMF